MGGSTMGDMRYWAERNCGEDVTRKNSRKLANNTLEFTLKDGTRCIQHWKTVVLAYYPNGDVLISPGRWSSCTTSNRIGRFGPSGISTYRSHGMWLSSDGKDRVKWQGDILLPNGQLPSPGEGMVWGLDGHPTTPEGKQNQRIRAQLRDLRHYLRDYNPNYEQVDWEFIERAVRAKHSDKAWKYLRARLFDVHEEDRSWRNRQFSYTYFPPAMKELMSCVKDYLRAHPEEVRYE